MASNTFSKTVTDWELLATTVAANAGDLEYLEPTRVELVAVLQTAMALGVQQDRQQAEAQQTSRVIEETLRRGEALAARLRAGVRSKYGYKSEKLREFQLRPLGRRSRVQEPAPQPEAPAPDPVLPV
jgi:hypothetical protein